MLNQELKKDYLQTFLIDENNNYEANGDYSIAKEYFSFANQDRTNKKLFITNLVIYIEDNAKLKYNKYGAETKLKNGLKIYYTTNNIKKYIIGDIEPIKSNRDWLKYSCDTDQVLFNNPHSFLKVTFDFSKNNNNSIILNRHDRFTIELNDDFTKLENHTFHITGFYCKA